MKLISLLLVAGSLGGCVAYPAPYGAGGPAYYIPGGYYGGSPVVLEQPVYMYGYGGYRYRSEPRPDWRARQRDRDGDRHHDGGRNRWDHDRDGDGVANRADRSPDDRRRH